MNEDQEINDMLVRGHRTNFLKFLAFTFVALVGFTSVLYFSGFLPRLMMYGWGNG